MCDATVYSQMTFEYNISISSFYLFNKKLKLFSYMLCWAVFSQYNREYLHDLASKSLWRCKRKVRLPFSEPASSRTAGKKSLYNRFRRRPGNDLQSCILLVQKLNSENK